MAKTIEDYLTFLDGPDYQQFDSSLQTHITKGMQVADRLKWTLDDATEVFAVAVNCYIWARDKHNKNYVELSEKLKKDYEAFFEQVEPLVANNSELFYKLPLNKQQEYNKRAPLLDESKAIASTKKELLDFVTKELKEPKTNPPGFIAKKLRQQPNIALRIAIEFTRGTFNNLTHDEIGVVVDCYLSICHLIVRLPLPSIKTKEYLNEFEKFLSKIPSDQFNQVMSKKKQNISK